MISSGEPPPDRIDEHRELARLSPEGRHVVATRSDHWVQFDEPELVVDANRDVIARAPLLPPAGSSHESASENLSGTGNRERFAGPTCIT